MSSTYDESLPVWQRQIDVKTNSVDDKHAPSRTLQSFRTAARQWLLRCGWDLRRAISIERNRQGEYRRRELEKWKLIRCYSPRTVLDIGANTGQFAELARELLPGVRIVSFEPLADCFRELEAQRDRLAPLDAFQLALGQEDVTAEFHRNEFSPSSSMLPMRDLHKTELPYTANTRIESVQVRRLDGLATQLRLEDPVFVKIDVQGFTEPVLLGGEAVIRRSSAVVAEVSVQPLYEFEATFRRVFEILTAWGFEYRGNVDQWVSERDGRVLQCDCLFENRNPSRN